MKKQEVIQILNNLIGKLEEPNFKLTIWKDEVLSYLKSLFPKSFEEKKKQIKGIEPIPTIIKPLTQEQKQHQENEIKKNMLEAKDTLKKILSNYIEEIEIKGLEESDRENELQENLETKSEVVDKLNEELREKEEIITQKESKIIELEKQIPKTFWQKVKKEGFGVTIVAVLVALVTWAITHYYNTGKDIGANRYEKSKYDLEVKVDTLTKRNNALILENKQLKNSFDSLKKLNVDKK